MVALADFRQTAPIPRKLESHSDFSTEIIASSIRSLHDFTPKLFVVKLTEPVRFEDSGWANFVEGVGGDTTLKDTEGRLEVPGVELVGSIDDALGFVFQNDYSSANCKSNVILAIDNKSVEEINNHVIHNKVSGELKTYYSFDEIGGDVSDDFNTCFSHEYLDNIVSGGQLPLHSLELKVGATMSMTMNLSVRDKLTNNTPVEVLECRKSLIIVKNLHTGTRHAIPRIPQVRKIKGTCIEIKRRQFPLRLKYAMTVNKSQGQTLGRCVFDTRTQPFSHGQLYVALSRVPRPELLRIFPNNGDISARGWAMVRNIVLRELLTH